MNGFIEKWAAQSMRRKVGWSVLAIFIVLVIVGTALPGSTKKPKQTATVVHVESAAEKAQTAREQAAEQAKQAEEAKKTKQNEDKEARENAALIKHEAAVRHHENHIKAVKERAQKSREAHERQVQGEKLEHEAHQEEAEENEHRAQWQGEEGEEARKALIASVKAQGGGREGAECIVKKFEGRFSLEEAVAVAQEVSATGEGNKEVMGFREQCESEGKV
jgi:flagellar biosynthesis GTPase FlhF